MNYTFSYDKNYNPTMNPEEIYIDFGVPESTVEHAIARLLLGDLDKKEFNSVIVVSVAIHLKENGLATFLYRHFYWELSDYFKGLAESCKDNC